MEARNIERLSWNHLDHKPKRRLRTAKVFAQTAQMDLLKLDKASCRVFGAVYYDCKLNSANSRRHFTGHYS